MRIAIYNSLYPPLGIGGAERSVQFLAEALVLKGHDVLVVSQGSSWTAVREVINGVTVVRLGSPPGFAPNTHDQDSVSRRALRVLFKKWKPQRAREAIREVTKFRADIAHSNAVSDLHDFWVGMERLGVPTVHTLRNPSLMCLRRMFAEGEPCASQCTGCREETTKRRKGTEKLSGVVGISDFILQAHLNNGYFHSLVLRRVIPNSYAAPSIVRVSREEGSPIRLGYLGRIHETKGVEVLVAAMRKFVGRAHLVVAGTGNPNFVDRLKATAGTNVEFVGFVQPANILKSVDALVVPSLWNEPFGRVYAEAMVHGVPVLGSVHGAGSELVFEGRTGWLCDPGDPTALNGALERCIAAIKLHAEELQQNCLLQAERYSPSVVASQYESFFREAIENHGRRAAETLDLKTALPLLPEGRPA